jgi:hypothetical protein
MTKPPPATQQRSEQAAEKRTRRPEQTLACGWCGSQIVLASTGRTPKWCSDSCRHRAWETSRAAATGAVAVRVVDRIVEVDKPVPVVQHVEVATLPKGAGWVAALHELARQLDAGKVYDRDLPALAGGVEELIAALTRRPGLRRHR